MFGGLLGNIDNSSSKVIENKDDDIDLSWLDNL